MDTIPADAVVNDGLFVAVLHLLDTDVGVVRAMVESQGK